jgi:hypothetical protein
LEHVILTTFDKNERFSANYHDPEEDRRGGWVVTEWTNFTYNDMGDVVARSGKKAYDCFSEDVAINVATELNLKWKLQNEQD